MKCTQKFFLLFLQHFWEFEIMLKEKYKFMSDFISAVMTTGFQNKILHGTFLLS